MKWMSEQFWAMETRASLLFFLYPVQLLLVSSKLLRSSNTWCLSYLLSPYDDTTPNRQDERTHFFFRVVKNRKRSIFCLVAFLKNS